MAVARVIRTVLGGIRIERLARYLPSGFCYAGISEDDFPSMAAILGENYAHQEIEKAPLRHIDLAPVAMDVYPVTRSEFLNFIWNISDVPMAESRRIDIEYWRKFDKRCQYPDDAPIVSMSFYEAQLFAWFHGGRLPTEEEWELAARGKKLKNFHPLFSEHSLTFPCNWHLGSPAQEALWPDRWRYLKPVTAFDNSFSPFGIQDLFGNAHEWVDSCFDIRSTNMPFRHSKKSNQWLCHLSRERIIKFVGISSKYPHPGRRSIMRTEMRFSKKDRFHRDGGLNRDSLVGFRCAYDL